VHITPQSMDFINIINCEPLSVIITLTSNLIISSFLCHPDCRPLTLRAYQRANTKETNENEHKVGWRYARYWHLRSHETKEKEGKIIMTQNCYRTSINSNMKSIWNNCIVPILFLSSYITRRRCVGIKCLKMRSHRNYVWDCKTIKKEKVIWHF